MNLDTLTTFHFEGIEEDEYLIHELNKTHRQQCEQMLNILTNGHHHRLMFHDNVVTILGGIRFELTKRFTNEDGTSTSVYSHILRTEDDVPLVFIMSKFCVSVNTKRILARCVSEISDSRSFLIRIEYDEFFNTSIEDDIEADDFL